MASKRSTTPHRSERSKAPLFTQGTSLSDGYGAVVETNLPFTVDNNEPSKVISPIKNVRTEVSRQQEIEMAAFGGYNSAISSADEGDEFQGKIQTMKQMTRTGRQRKRDATRTKGGEFQTRRRKRRIHFMVLSSETNVELLAEKFTTEGGFNGLRGKLYDEVLHLYLDNTIQGTGAVPVPGVVSGQTRGSSAPYTAATLSVVPPAERADARSPLHIERRDTLDTDGGEGTGASSPPHQVPISPRSPVHDALGNTGANVNNANSGWSGKEVFVFDFGGVVFWGFPREEESQILQLIREYSPGGCLSPEEFERAEDDMAFVVAESAPTTDDTGASANAANNEVTIANDVVYLPPASSVKSRLAVSFAIAQSAVLSIFEHRIDKKVAEYKYIPETLSIAGKLNLSSKKLAIMIGEVFVIRHDVNLHSEILNTPDYFWNEHAVMPIYRMTMTYLEMEQRTQVLNIRLDMVKELLSVLQQQHETAHGTKLEWIVIWLIVMSCVLEFAAMVGGALGFWRMD